MLRIAHTIPATAAEGPHTRFAIWVQGCSLACPGCCNPDLFSPEGGEPYSTDALLGQLDAARAHSEIEGITVLGGEPLEQPEGLLPLVREVAARGLGVIVFTGFDTATVTASPTYAPLSRHVDTWVTGPFDVHAPERRRRYIGSANQELLHVSSRYADAALWEGPARVEVQIGPDGAIHSHGLPGPLARLTRAANRPR